METGKGGTAYREPKLIYLNQHDGTFLAAGGAAGKDVLVPQVSRGLAVADLFHRSVLDIIVENLDGSPMILDSHADPPTIGSASRSRDAPTNKLALIARVRVTIGKVQQLGEVRSGGSYLSHSELALHFEVGAAQKIDKVESIWRGGAIQTFTQVPADGFYKLSRGVH